MVARSELDGRRRRLVVDRHLEEAAEVSDAHEHGLDAGGERDRVSCDRTAGELGGSVDSQDTRGSIRRRGRDGAEVKIGKRAVIHLRDVPEHAGDPGVTRITLARQARGALQVEHAVRDRDAAVAVDVAGLLRAHARQVGRRGENLYSVRHRDRADPFASPHTCANVGPPATIALSTTRPTRHLIGTSHTAHQLRLRAYRTIPNRRGGGWRSRRRHRDWCRSRSW